MLMYKTKMAKYLEDIKDKYTWQNLIKSLQTEKFSFTKTNYNNTKLTKMWQY